MVLYFRKTKLSESSGDCFYKTDPVYTAQDFFSSTMSGLCEKIQVVPNARCRK